MPPLRNKKLTAKQNGEEAAGPFWRNEYGAGKHELVWQPGLTKREAFAAMMMQTVLENDLLPNHPMWESKSQVAAGLACAYADALLAELEKEPKP